MTYKFILFTDYETATEVNAFADHLKKLGHGWWHRTANSWIIVSRSFISEIELRNSATSYFPKRNILVINLQNKNWCGWGLTEDFDWFKDNWVN